MELTAAAPHLGVAHVEPPRRATAAAVCGVPSGADTAGGRDAVLRIIGRHGPVTANAAAVMLGVTPAAVRRHLDTLTAAGLADAHDAGGSALRGRGRPARSYVLTAQGRTALGRTVAGAEPTVGGPEDLAADALDFIARTHGAQAVARFAHQRAKAMESRFAGAVAAAGPDPRDRSRALAEALEAEGYAATARPVATGVQLCQGRCPVHRVAAAHPELCEAETAAFGRLLGVPVQRLATLAGGAHVCTTHVVSRRAITAPAPPTTAAYPTPPTPPTPPVPPAPPAPTSRPAPTSTRRRVPVASGRDRP